MTFVHLVMQALGSFAVISAVDGWAKQTVALAVLYFLAQICMYLERIVK